MPRGPQHRWSGEGAREAGEEARWSARLSCWARNSCSGGLPRRGQVAHALRSAALQPAGVQEYLGAAQALLLHPATTLAAGTCYRPFLLKALAPLVDAAVPHGGEQLALALLRLLELAPHIEG